MKPNKEKEIKKHKLSMRERMESEKNTQFQKKT